MFGLVNILSALFVLLFGFHAYITFDRSRKSVWMVVNVLWLAMFAALSFWQTTQNYYFLAGLVLAAIGLVRSVVSGGFKALSSASAKTFFTTVVFYPVSAFETVYSFLSPKL